MRGLVTHLLLGVLGLALALGLAEVALRTLPLPLPDLKVLAAFQKPPESDWRDPAWGDPPSRAWRESRVIGYEHAPNRQLQIPIAEHPGGSFCLCTNNLGLRRDAETAVQKGPGVFRVLVLGDSHTDGYVNNDETFATLLEASLATPLAAVGRRAEVLNGGVAGYSTGEEYLWYEQNGARLQPDAVVVVFYPGNDPLELLDPYKAKVNPANGRPVPPLDQDTVKTPRGPLDGLRLMLLARYAVQAGPLAGPWRQLGLPGRTTEVGGYPYDTLIRVLRLCHGCFFQGLEQAVGARRDPRALQQATDLAAATLARLDRVVRDDGQRLLVAVLPTRPQVEPERAAPLQQASAALLGLSQSELTYDDEVARSVLAQLNTAGVPTLDLRPPLTAAARIEPMYYSRDWHLDPAGHRVTAAALAASLASQGLLPGR